MTIRYFTFREKKYKLTEQPYSIFKFITHNTICSDFYPEEQQDILVEIFLMIHHCLPYLTKHKYHKSLYQAYTILLYAEKTIPEQYTKLSYIRDDIISCLQSIAKQRFLLPENNTCLISKEQIPEYGYYYLCKSKKHVYKDKAWELWCSYDKTGSNTCPYCSQKMYQLLFLNSKHKKSKNGRILKQINYTY